MTAEPTTARSHWLRNTVIVLVVLVVIGVGIVATYALTLSRTFDTGTEKIAEAFPEETSRPPVLEGAAASAQNILLLGSDTRGAIGEDLATVRGQRSDTIMVLHIPADRENVQVMSIMRDSWVDIPGRGAAKVNSALSYGGVPLAVQTVESLISARIDHVAIIDFEGFKGLTDALGGVDVDNAVAFTRDGHAYPQGVQTLNGEQALGFVRERYSFRDGDFQRARNQQAYIKAVIGKVLSAETLTDPAKISALVGSISPYLRVDNGLNAAYVGGLGLELRSLRSEDITFFTAPTTGTGTSPDGQSIVNLDPVGMAEVQEAFRTDSLESYTPEFQTTD
ncbi:LCP family protein [Planctomonas psychrotolerans]|uniref:LCP family protein n=1 Tax=Planctomonas psychrotolerans TaxID=2528712 RepID=UPI00123BF783|nr:LCP family protein [Planctomonas psychrotolerans]